MATTKNYCTHKEKCIGCLQPNQKSINNNITTKKVIKKMSDKQQPKEKEKEKQQITKQQPIKKPHKPLTTDSANIPKKKSSTENITAVDGITTTSDKIDS